MMTIVTDVYLEFLFTSSWPLQRYTSCPPIVGPLSPPCDSQWSLFPLNSTHALRSPLNRKELHMRTLFLDVQLLPSQSTVTEGYTRAGGDPTHVGSSEPRMFRQGRHCIAPNMSSIVSLPLSPNIVSPYLSFQSLSLSLPVSLSLWSLFVVFLSLLSYLFCHFCSFCLFCLFCRFCHFCLFCPFCPICLFRPFCLLVILSLCLSVRLCLSASLCLSVCVSTCLCLKVFQCDYVLLLSNGIIF